MAKTLRVRTRTGWITKPAADTPENRLIAEEVDDNFLALEDAVTNKKAFEIGYAALVARALNMPGWIPMDGTQYTNTQYPDLGALLGGVFAVGGYLPDVPTPTSDARNIRYSPDGSKLAVGLGGFPYFAVIDVPTWAFVSGTPSLPSVGQEMSFSPDGSMLAVPHVGSPYVTIFETDTWTKVSGPQMLTGDKFTCSFSPDGEYLAIGSSSGTYLVIVRPSNWTEVTSVPQPGSQVNSVAFSPDGATLVVAEATNLVIMNTSDWSVAQEVTISAAVHLRFNSDGSRLAMAILGSPAVRVLDTSSWTELSGTPTISATGVGVDWSPDDKYLCVATRANTRLLVYDASTWNSVYYDPSFAGNPEDCAFSPLGGHLMLAHDGSPYLTGVYTESQTEFIVPALEAPSSDMQWRIKAEDV